MKFGIPKWATDLADSILKEQIASGECLCGGKTKYFSGPLGYVAWICETCGYHWRPGETDEQIYCYLKAKEAKEQWSGCSDEVSFDDDPVVSKAEDGAWVAAWVWVPDVDVEPELLSRSVDKALAAAGVVKSRERPNK